MQISRQFPIEMVYKQKSDRLRSSIHIQLKLDIGETTESYLRDQESGIGNKFNEISPWNVILNSNFMVR